VIPCDEIPWDLVGYVLAAFAALLASLAAYVGALAGRLRRRR